MPEKFGVCISDLAETLDVAWMDSYMILGNERRFCCCHRNEPKERFVTQNLCVPNPNIKKHIIPVRKLPQTKNGKLYFSPVFFQLGAWEGQCEA